MQIIAPLDARSSDKQIVDKTVLLLKRLCRDYNMTIFAISSFNRDNYYEPVGMTSFKESGAIEYSSDVLLGLQQLGMNFKNETLQARKERIKKLHDSFSYEAELGGFIQVECKILKNRNGSKGVSLFNFYPKFNCFLNVNENGVEINKNKSKKNC